MTPYYQENGITIYHGDCREVLPSLSPVDLVLTDPPYGIGYRPDQWKKWNGAPSGWQTIQGDDAAFNPAFLLVFPNAILWGASYFSDKLPIGDWLIWDKRCGRSGDKMFGTSVESAWMSGGNGTIHIKRLLHGGVINADSFRGNNAHRMHPTQKPLDLMRWCISFYPNAQMILDPYMGSGTTLRAAKDLGRQAIGIEIEERYCEIAANRLRQEVLQFEVA